MDLRVRWPAVRAALIALALGFGIIDGCPIPERKYSPAWSHDLIGYGETARRFLLKPVAGYARDLDINQRWSLFRGASRKRYRLWLEGKTATGQWEPLYISGDSTHVAYEELLAYRRIRGTYNPSGQNPRGQYRGFATWMTLRVLDDRPELAVVRTRMEKIVIQHGGGYTPTGDFTFEHQEPRRRK
jgi:hypothetical protein